MLFMPYMQSNQMKYKHVKTLDKLAFLLAGSTTPVMAPLTHLVSEYGPETLHPSFIYI